MTRGECKENIKIVVFGETLTDTNAAVFAETGCKSAYAKVVTLSASKSLQLGLDAMVSNIEVSTYSTVNSDNVIEWRGIRYKIGSLVPKYERSGTYYVLTCSVHNGN